MRWTTLALTMCLPIASAAAQWSGVDRVFGRSGTAQPNGVMRYSFPRSDLQVTVGNVAIKPALALGSWIAFKEMPSGKVMIAGDLVLLESEVLPVMRALQEGGVQQSAIHHHLLGETPHVLYMHVMGTGKPSELAQTIRDALAESKTPLTPAPGAPASSPLDLDTVGVARTLGFKGKASGGVYQVAIPRKETIRDHEREVPPSMGVATAINFQPMPGGNAAITGDFVLLASEVNPVLRELLSNGITVTSLHSHMLSESPRLFFMHFWANDEALKLSRGLRAALDHTTTPKVKK